MRRRTIRYKNTFNLATAFRTIRHVLLGLVAPSAAGLGVCVAGGAADGHLCGELGKVLRDRAALYLLPVGRPAKVKSTVLVIKKNLKHALHGRGLGYVLHESAKQKVDLLLAHVGRAAPVGPAGFVDFVIVAFRDVYDRVDEAQDHTVRSPVDDDVHGHIITVQDNFVCFSPVWTRATVP
jgi:hypothetical protein